MRQNHKNWTLIAIGLAWIVVGICMIIYRAYFMLNFINLTAVGIGLLSIVHIVKLIFNRQADGEKSLVVRIIDIIGHFIVMTIILLNPDQSIKWLFLVLGIYQLLMALSGLIAYLVMKRDNAPERFHRLVFALLEFIFALIMFFSRFREATTSVMVGIYLIFIGLTFINDGRGAVISRATEDQFKRRIRVPMPIFLDFLLPNQVLKSINNYIEGELNLDQRAYSISVIDKTEIPEGYKRLKIEVQTTDSSFDVVGHLNIAYDDRVYSYGNHDESSHHLGGALGDGVLVVTNREKYLDFCMQRDATIIEYDVLIGPAQQKKLEQEIAKLMAKTYPYQPTTVAQKEGYGGQLYAATDANFYKFKSGQYKTYFVMWTNCVLLADELIGVSGLDLFAMVGVLTPGTYYNYLESELNRPNSIVVARQVFDKDFISKYDQPFVTKEETV